MSVLRLRRGVSCRDRTVRCLRSERRECRPGTRAHASRHGADQPARIHVGRQRRAHRRARR